MNYGDILPSCPSGRHDFNQKDIAEIMKLYPRIVIDGREALRWACIGVYCKEYVNCYSKAYLQELKDGSRNTTK